ncbi:interleukin-20 receptor subunit alpha [Oryzias latipes]|uniref:Fibronectin type-III domain-containing protein n=1 Tax=Oryzias latipes TaxID=8090 RepID=A0A3B3H6M8_ORYLA|nr:interleukin-20 receptor subunit alpha [Oryzias latipes]
MWTAFVLMNLLGLTCTVGSFPPSPINVSFSSVNLRNVLHWLPGHDTPNDTHFTVQYAIYGESVDGGNQLKWMAVRQCTAIVRTWCDLSAQTSDLDDGYYARVRSVVRKKSSKWTGLQRRFDPKEETRLGPPLITVEVHNNTATITLKGPMRYQLNNQTTAISMAEIYTHMTYNLSVHNTHLDQMHHYVLQKGFFKYRLLSYNTKYCFSAQSRLLFMPIECQRSAWYCITTAQDPLIEQLQRVVVGIIFPFLFICVIVVAGFILHRYMSGKEEKSPSVLKKPFDKFPLQNKPFDKFPLDQTIHDCPVTEDNRTAKEPLLHPIDQCPNNTPPPSYSPPSYSPQRPAEPEELQNDFSVEYGDLFVTVDSEGREHQTRQAKLTEDGDVQGGLSYHPQNLSHMCPSANLQTHFNKCTDVFVISGYASQNPNEMEGVPFLPGLEVQFREEGNLEPENPLEPYVTKSVINMDDVFFAQNSETDWTEKEMDEDVTNDLVAKWNLTISMD